MPSRHEHIYARKWGTALTLDHFAPENLNGIGLILVVSGGWVSSHAKIDDYFPGFIGPLLARGFSVFAVVPGSQPKFAIPEIIANVQRAVRFVRFNAENFDFNPAKIGIYGASAGGHSSLMVALTGDAGNPDDEDPIERTSSRVQAVTQFYGPTDFFNYGGEGFLALGDGILKDYRAPFDFQEFDEQTGRFERLSSSEYERALRQISPISHVSEDAPPILAIHGNADELVPLQQSQILVEKLQNLGAKAHLEVVLGGGHGWEDMSREVILLGDWFAAHLLDS